MPIIDIGRPLLFNFVEQFLGRNNQIGVSLNRERFTVQTEEPVLVQMLQRANTDQTFILPYSVQHKDTWMLTGATRHFLENDLEQVRHFIVPSYSAFSDGHFYPQFHLFSEQKHELQRLGAELFPESGYFAWRSPDRYRDRMFEHIGMWMNLATHRPVAEVDTTPTYKALYQQFNDALATAQWNAAERTIIEMQRNHLMTAANHYFLKIQLFSQQQRWDKIWQMNDFTQIASVSVPREVRAAMLIAFHQTCLAAHERNGDWPGAFEQFLESKSRLGRLLETRAGLTMGSVLRVFAYQAVADESPAALNALLDHAADAEGRAYLREIGSLLPAIPEQILAPEDAIDQAIAKRDYDTAFEQAHRIMDIGRMLHSAALSRDPATAAIVLSYYRHLSPEEQEYWRKQRVGVEIIQTLSPEPTVANRSWLDWFDVLEENPSDPALESAAESLKQHTDKHFWTSQIAATLLGRLQPLVVNESPILSLPIAREVLSHLIDVLLQDPQFPRDSYDFQELYQTFSVYLDGQRKNDANGFKLIRLADGQLEYDPGQIHYIASSLQNWFTTPSPKLEPVVLEALEMLDAYGVQPDQLIDTFRVWLTDRVGRPTNWDPLSAEVWLQFGRWLHADSYLLEQLESKLEAQGGETAQDVLTLLPTDYRIGVFSLRESSAQRVKQILERRNHNLDIRLCHDKVMSEQAAAIATNSDMVVLVTAAMKHALYDGIQELVGGDRAVYPDSPGTTAIIRAIESHAQKVVGARLTS